MSTRIFTPFPTLITERLTLRQLTLHDAQDIFVLRSDPDINKYLGRTPSKSVEEAINFIHIITENTQKNESVYWVISLTDNNIFAGTICLFDFSDELQQCEIGYELLGKFQGKGIMQETAKKVIEYAGQTLKIQTIEAFTHQNNEGSTRLLEKLEFKKVGEVDGDLYGYRFSNKI